MILAEGARRKLRPGQVLYRMGESAESLFLLLKGRLQLSRPLQSGREVLVSILVPGDVFGLVSLLNRHVSYMGTAEAMEAGEAMVWDRATVQRLARDHPQLTANALAVALAMVAQFAARHEALVDGSAAERLAGALSDLGSQSGTRSPDGNRHPHQQPATGSTRGRECLYGQPSVTAVGTGRRGEETPRHSPHRRSRRAVTSLTIRRLPGASGLAPTEEPSTGSISTKRTA